MHLVHLLAAYAVLLSNLSSGLRDETIRLNLEAGEAEVREEEAKGGAQLELTYNERADHSQQGDTGNAEVLQEQMADSDASGTNVLSIASCINGTLELWGQNVVNTSLVFPKECVKLHGDPGSQVILEEPLVFKGDLQMDGDIHFFATRVFYQKPCVEIKGDASAFGNIHFEKRRNEGRCHQGGGGLRVGGDLTQHGGTIQFRNCCSDGDGGGLYAHGDLTQNQGKLDFTNCSSNGFGGGLYVSKTLTQSNGFMKFQNCHAEGNGGGLFADHAEQNNGTMEFTGCSSNWPGGGLATGAKVQQNNGTMEFKGCSSKAHGGGLATGGKVQQNNGTMEFTGCSSKEGGGLYVSETLTQNTGSINFQNCHAELEGGGLYAYEHVTQNNGTMEFKGCSSKEGGGIRVQKLTQNNGSMQFQNCHAYQYGGGLYAKRHLEQNNGTMEFKGCSSKEGGGLYAVSALTQNNGSMKFQKCHAEGEGGGLATGGKVQQNNGKMEFTGCSSKEGGGLYAYEHVTQNNGTMEFKGCSSKEHGGGLYAVSALTQNNGSMKFQKCHAEGEGGGLYAYEHLTQNNGTMEFTGCSSKAHGGGLYIHSSMTQNNGTMEFKNCSSKKNGGGLYIDSSLAQNNGKMGFNDCSSEENGGGMYIPGEYLLSHGAAVFHHCVAKENGGGMWVHRFQQEAPVSFKNCVAAIGGGLDAYMVNGTEPMYFHQCQATEAGGGICIRGLEGSGLQNVQFEECVAGRASAIQARNLTIQSLALVDTFNQTVDAVSLKMSTATFQVQGTPDLSMEAVDLQIDSDMDCSQLRECRLIVTSSAPKLGGFQCRLGAGVAQHPAFGCLACPEGYTQIENVTNGSCHQCPTGASLCHAGKIQMMHGLMLHERNVSRPMHCPTKAACHGGELPVNESRPMCQKGYGGEGCASCVSEEGSLYLMPDSSVLACTRCAPGSVSQLLQWCSFLGQRFVLFAVSAASIFAAGHADRVKNSGVYLNQLMAFAAVSGSVVTAVIQTETAQTMKNAAVQSLYGTAIFLSEAGSGQGSKSTHCLLSYLGLESTGLFGVHCLDLVVATSLVLLLSFKDFRVALVAGLNCFLPGILADFAKYAVCYSLEEDQTGGMKDLICKHLPLSFGNLLGFVAVGACFLTVFTVSLLVWIRLSTSKAKEEPSHVAFLTNKYGEGRRYFEAERLVRKVLLATAAAFYPSTSFPAPQMTGLTIITCASMFLYGIFHPYRQQIWNWSELGLLATAQLLIAGAAAVISNEEQWDKTEIGQMSMIVTLGAIVTAVCSAFMIKIATEIWNERRPADRSHPDESPE